MFVHVCVSSNDNIHARFTAQRPCAAVAPPLPMLPQHAAVSHRCYFAAAAAATISFVRAREIACELKSSRKFPVSRPQS